MSLLRPIAAALVVAACAPSDAADEPIANLDPALERAREAIVGHLASPSVASELGVALTSDRVFPSDAPQVYLLGYATEDLATHIYVAQFERGAAFTTVAPAEGGELAADATMHVADAEGLPSYSLWSYLVYDVSSFRGLGRPIATPTSGDDPLVWTYQVRDCVTTVTAGLPLGTFAKEGSETCYSPDSEFHGFHPEARFTADPDIVSRLLARVTPGFGRPTSSSGLVVLDEPAIMHYDERPWLHISLFERGVAWVIETTQEGDAARSFIAGAIADLPGERRLFSFWMAAGGLFRLGVPVEIDGDRIRSELPPCSWMTTVGEDSFEIDELSGDEACGGDATYVTPTHEPWTPSHDAER